MNDSTRRMRGLSVRIVTALLAACWAFATGLAPVQAATTIYRCVHDGLVEYADRPCAAVAQRLELDLEHVNTYHASESKVQTSGKSASTRQRPSAKSDPVPRAGDQACERLKAQVRALDARMRQGYRGAAGERMRARARELRLKLRDACR
jgi:hypothetical protein